MTLLVQKTTGYSLVRNSNQSLRKLRLQQSLLRAQLNSD